MKRRFDIPRIFSIPSFAGLVAADVPAALAETKFTPGSTLTLVSISTKVNNLDSRTYVDRGVLITLHPFGNIIGTFIQALLLPRVSILQILQFKPTFNFFNPAQT